MSSKFFIVVFDVFWAYSFLYPTNISLLSEIYLQNRQILEFWTRGGVQANADKFDILFLIWPQKGAKNTKISEDEHWIIILRPRWIVYWLNGLLGKL